MTLRVRLIFAGAGSAHAAGTSAAARLLGAFSCRGRGRLFQNPGFELVFYLREILGIGLEIARVRPLEARLQYPADPEIGISQMIVDRGVFRLELDRAFEVLDCFLVVANAVIGPAERINDVAVVRALLDRALNHFHSVIEMDALID